uniref:PHD-type domain-containing protein n=1 Tax=Ananas comosus var. bracteatus TaxID=296719 RepID=A0A6V7QQV4_ANACO
MESATTVHGLPPSKRFKLLHSFDPHIQNPKSLPAKKRADLRDGTNPICLPPRRGSTDGDPSDPIVFCDGCDLMVHALCYGNPLARSIPEGDWFCLRCDETKTKTKNAMESTTNCCLCSAEGGAVKPTVDGEWAHITCSLLVPEVFFHDPEGRDRIDCSRVPERRWRKRCYVCGSGRGCAIECSEPKCELGFHVSCGLDEGLCIEYKEGKRGAVVAGFCGDHTKLWEKQQLTGKFRIVAREDAPKRKARA